VRLPHSNCLSAPARPKLSDSLPVCMGMWSREIVRRLRATASVATLAICLALASPSDSSALQAKVIPPAAACAQCRVVAERLLTLGSDGLDLLSLSSSFARDSRGRYYGVAFGDRQIVVWDSTGRYFNTLGSAGNGPGEFKGSISGLIVGPHDSVFVVDEQIRLNVFTPQLTFARFARLPAPVRGTALLPDGQFVVRADIGTAGSAGLPLHLLSPHGDVVRSFGARSTATSAGSSADNYTYAVPANDATSVWLYSSGNYMLEQWFVSGDPVMTLDLTSSPWFLAVPPPPPLSRDELRAYMAVRTSPSAAVRDSLSRALARPQSSVRLAGTDSSGLLWVFAVGYDRRPAVGPGTPLLEIIDPRRGIKVLSEPNPQRFDGFLPNSSLAYGREVDSDGVTRMVVWRMRLEGYIPRAGQL
jgi:hypothetical protein